MEGFCCVADICGYGTGAVRVRVRVQCGYMSMAEVAVVQVVQVDHG